MSSEQQADLEAVISTLATMAKRFAGIDQFVSSRLGVTAHDLSTYVQAQRWNSWIASRQAASQRRHFSTRHKTQKGVSRKRA
jgi:hypothetical protein